MCYNRPFVLHKKAILKNATKAFKIGTFSKQIHSKGAKKDKIQ